MTPSTLSNVYALVAFGRVNAALVEAADSPDARPTVPGFRRVDATIPAPTCLTSYKATEAPADVVDVTALALSVPPSLRPTGAKKTTSRRHGSGCPECFGSGTVAVRGRVAGLFAACGCKR